MYLLNPFTIETNSPHLTTAHLLIQQQPFNWLEKPTPKLTASLKKISLATEIRPVTGANPNEGDIGTVQGQVIEC
jgi:hypothetical protein